MKNSKNTCQNCHFFDDSRHKNDNRTSHAGLCLKWSEINLKTSTCNQFKTICVLDGKPSFNKPIIDVEKLPHVSQLSFF